MITLIIAFVIIAAVTVFSVQNATPVAVSFLSWKFEVSLALVLLIFVLSGVAVGIIASSLYRRKGL